MYVLLHCLSCSPASMPFVFIFTGNNSYSDFKPQAKCHFLSEAFPNFCICLLPPFCYQNSLIFYRYSSGQYLPRGSIIICDMPVAVHWQPDQCAGQIFICFVFLGPSIVPGIQWVFIKYWMNEWVPWGNWKSVCVCVRERERERRLLQVLLLSNFKSQFSWNEHWKRGCFLHEIARKLHLPALSAFWTDTHYWQEMTQCFFTEICGFVNFRRHTHTNSFKNTQIEIFCSLSYYISGVSKLFL